MWFIATPEDLKSGRLTDVYFERTVQILKAAGIRKHVVMEVRATHLPQSYDWGIFVGVEEALRLLEGLPVDVDGLEEGSVFRAGEPVLRVSGEYTQFGVYETSLLGILCQASGVATKAARCKKAAGHRLLLSFGARRMHPAIAPMIDRAAYIGGCDGVAVMMSAELIGIKPSGTMPHALILLIGDTVEALKWFDKVIDPSVPRVALIDTFNDEKFEAIRCAEALDEKLAAVRFDTPGSRRGDMLELLREVRWELDIRGFKHVKLFVSGGLDEYEISQLNEVADAYGVGTSISNAPTINFAMDIVEIEGKPVAKRGKMSGAKDIWRCEQCLHGVVTMVNQEPEGRCTCCGGDLVKVTKPLMRNGEIVTKIRSPREIRESVLAVLPKLEPIR
ncbi:MAG: nicotinate phosphoribosyltransferase [Candidatus Fervidibacter sp.]|uniref:nicotinate phosphoribosyltransferase n=1 Tax=Candidatus Fervidibacter sp. TaxID=3100871 RepID=UPI004049F159